MKKYLPNYSAVVAGFFLSSVSASSFAKDVSGDTSRQISPQLTDRLVIAVGGSSYSERHVVVWMTLRELMQEVPKGESLSVKKRTEATSSYLQELRNNWSAVLEKFNEDMLIKLESSRLGSSAPSERSVVAVAQRVERHRKLDPELNTALIKLGVTEEEKMRFIANIIQVESFRTTREKQRPSIGVTRSAGGSSGSFMSGSFISGLKARYTSRRYDGASEPGKVLESVLP